MPKLKKKDLDKVQYKSIQDFLLNFDKYDSIKDKLAYTTRYILQHGASNERDFSFAQFVQVARQKIAEASGKTKAPNGKEAPNYLVDKSVEDEKNDLAAEMFLSNPADYIKNEANKVIDEIDADEVNFEWQDELKENCERLLPDMDKNFNDRQFLFDQHSAYYGVKARTQAALGGKEKLDELYKATQPSRFSRIFATYSAKWVALEDAYESFNNPNKYGFGKMDHLNDAAIDYLKHKFPKWNPGEEIPAKAYSKLNKTELAKVNFSVNILDAIRGQKEAEKNFHSLVDATKEKEIKYSDIPEDSHEVIDLDQLDFQNQIKLDAELDKDSLSESVNEATIDHDLEKEDSIEEEVLDQSSLSN